MADRSTATSRRIKGLIVTARALRGAPLFSVLRPTKLFGEQILDEHVDGELGLPLEHGFILKEIPQLFLGEWQPVNHLRVDDVTGHHIIVPGVVKCGEGLVWNFVRLIDLPLQDLNENLLDLSATLFAYITMIVMRFVDRLLEFCAGHSAIV